MRMKEEKIEKKTLSEDDEPDEEMQQEFEDNRPEDFDDSSSETDSNSDYATNLRVVSWRRWWFLRKWW